MAGFTTELTATLFKLFQNTEKDGTPPNAL